MGRRNTLESRREEIIENLARGKSMKEIAIDMNEPYCKIQRFIQNKNVLEDSRVRLCSECPNFRYIKYHEGKQLRICLDRESIIPSRLDVAPKGFCRYGKMV